MGQLIASLENTQENITFERAQIAFEKAQVQYADDSIGYSRLTNEAKGNLKLKAGLKDAELSLREARINLEKTQIIAPFSGTVAQLVKKIGDRGECG